MVVLYKAWEKKVVGEVWRRFTPDDLSVQKTTFEKCA